MGAERREPDPPAGEKPAGGDGAPARTKQGGKPTHAEARAACMVRFPTERRVPVTMSHLTYLCTPLVPAPF